VISNSEDGALVVFVHIPKTAGSTLETMLRDQYSSAETYKINYNGSRKQVRRLKDALRLQRGTLRLVHGHMDFSWSAMMPADTRFFTLLRDPVDRVMSHYYHYRQETATPLHPLAMHSSLLQWVRDCGIDEMDNGQTRRIAGAMPLPCGAVTSKTLEQAKANLASKFAVVGLTERFDESQILIHREFGWPLRRYPRRRVNAKRAQRSEVGEDVLREIEKCNRFDLELYRFAVELFEKRSSQIDMARELALLQAAPEHVAPIVGPGRSTPADRGFLPRLKRFISRRKEP
jgi:hypothetical protein